MMKQNHRVVDEIIDDLENPNITNVTIVLREITELSFLCERPYPNEDEVPDDVLKMAKKLVDTINLYPNKVIVFDASLLKCRCDVPGGKHYPFAFDLAARVRVEKVSLRCWPLGSHLNDNRRVSMFLNSCLVTKELDLRKTNIAWKLLCPRKKVWKYLSFYTGERKSTIKIITDNEKLNRKLAKFRIKNLRNMWQKEYVIPMRTFFLLYWKSAINICSDMCLEIARFLLSQKLMLYGEVMLVDMRDVENNQSNTEMCSVYKQEAKECFTLGKYDEAICKCRIALHYADVDQEKVLYTTIGMIYFFNLNNYNKALSYFKNPGSDLSKIMYHISQAFIGIHPGNFCKRIYKFHIAKHYKKAKKLYDVQVGSRTKRRKISSSLLTDHSTLLIGEQLDVIEQKLELVSRDFLTKGRDHLFFELLSNDWNYRWKNRRVSEYRSATTMFTFAIDTFPGRNKNLICLKKIAANFESIVECVTKKEFQQAKELRLKTLKFLQSSDCINHITAEDQQKSIDTIKNLRLPDLQEEARPVSNENIFRSQNGVRFGRQHNLNEENNRGQEMYDEGSFNVDDLFDFENFEQKRRQHNLNEENNRGQEMYDEGSFNVDDLFDFENFEQKRRQHNLNEENNRGQEMYDEGSFNVDDLFDFENFEQKRRNQM